jgi:ribonuclease R
MPPRAPRGGGKGPRPDGTPARRAGKLSSRRDSRPDDLVVVEITGTDPDGDPVAKPVSWTGPRPVSIRMRPEPAGQPALAPGERVLARLTHIRGDLYEGRSFKRIAGAPPGRILGLFEHGRIRPVDRRHKADWQVPQGEEGGALPGEIVLAEPLPRPAHRVLGARPARIVQRLGASGEARSVSLVCIHAHGLPDAFPDAARREAEAARGVSARGREDLRALPLVTIDGEDARDFDDAVFAEPDGSGWRILVAIADVAHYVHPGSALDREAWARGNSVYFPDRVVPMLPEALSNGWCSLKPAEDRGCLFVDMRLDAQGRKQAHRFGRGIMRSAARLTYEQVQAAHDGLGPDPAPPQAIAHLYGAFRALARAREARGTLDLDLPERRVLLDEDGRVRAVVPRARLASHRLIEEFMIAANVAAAEELERHSAPCLYRIHDRPSDAKLESLRQVLASFDLSLPPAGLLKARHFSALLARMRDRPEERLIHEVVLRGQSQAAYSPDNIGHFGLALPRYAHFTSPIRRYADLVVHRALIAALRLGRDGLTAAETARLPETAEHISETERRAAAAERDAVDRFLAAYLEARIGATFAARISGVARFGLFVSLEETGASGLVPLGFLPDDRWVHDETRQRLCGARSRFEYHLGQAVEATLVEASGTTGGLIFRLAPPPGAARRGRRG